MKAFEVRVNGQRICCAGVGSNGVLTTILDWVGRGGEGRVHLRVGGLLSAKDEHVEWQTPAVDVGDEISIKVVEAHSVDKPTTRRLAADTPG